MSHTLKTRLRAWFRDLEVMATPIFFRVFLPFVLLNVCSILVSQNGVFLPLWLASFVFVAHGAVMLRRSYMQALDHHIESRVVGALVSVLHESQHAAPAPVSTSEEPSPGASYADQLHDLADQDAVTEAAA